MAKKKSSVQEKPTAEQYEKIANTIRGTTKNIYHVSEDILGYQVGEEIFEVMDDIGIFRCAECKTWLDIDEMSDGTECTCQECIDEIDSDEDEDEEDWEDEDSDFDDSELDSDDDDDGWDSDDDD